MPNIGPVELVIILVIALLIIGPGKLPDVGSALGKSIREFRKAATDVQESVKLDAQAGPAATAVPAATTVPAAQTAPPPPAAAAQPTAPPIVVAAIPIEPAPDPAATAADAATEARV